MLWTCKVCMSVDAPVFSSSRHNLSVSMAFKNLKLILKVQGNRILKIYSDRQGTCPISTWNMKRGLIVKLLWNELNIIFICQTDSSMEEKYFHFFIPYAYHKWWPNWTQWPIQWLLNVQHHDHLCWTFMIAIGSVDSLP